MVTKASPRRSQQERTRATTTALVAAARELFVERGFAGTALGAICDRAGVTRGAFYHHFDNKEQIFREVFAAEQRKQAAAVERAFLAERDPWDGLLAGCRTMLEVSLDPVVRRITLIEAPAALDWTALRDMHAGCKEQLRTGLGVAMRAGCIPAGPAEPLTSLLYGGLCESALDLARAGDPQTVLRDTMAGLEAMLAGVAGRGSGCAHRS